MLELLEKLLTLDWRRRGAALREIDLDGGVIWYAEFPRRKRKAPPAQPPTPTQVLVHGLGASATAFHPLISRLRRDYRIVVPDLPGHGRSHLPQGKEFLDFSELYAMVQRFLEAVVPGGALLAGNSLGGWLSAKLAARRPDLVQALCLLNPGGPALQAADWTAFTELIASKGTLDVNQYFSRVFHRSPFGASLFGRDLRRVLSMAQVSRFVQTISLGDFLTEAEAARVSCPSALVWGEDDHLLPQACRSWYLENLPGVRYVPLTDCGHCPQIERPARVAEVLRDLAEVASCRATPPAWVPRPASAES